MGVHSQGQVCVHKKYQADADDWMQASTHTVVFRVGCSFKGPFVYMDNDFLLIQAPKAPEFTFLNQDGGVCFSCCLESKRLES